MKQLCKRIIAVSLVFVILFFACVPPAYASSFDVLPNFINTDIFNWIIDFSARGQNYYLSFFYDDVCPASSVYGGRHSFVEQRTTVNGKTGLYYICEYCGKSAGEIGEEAYTDYVSTLPSPNYSSDGNLRWRLNFSSAKPDNSSITITSFIGGSSFAVQYISNNGKSNYFNVYVDKFTAPINGDYHLGAYLCQSDSLSGSIYRSFPDSQGKLHFFADFSALSYSTVLFSNIANTGYYEFPTVKSYSAGSTIIGSTYFSVATDRQSYETINGYVDVICTPVLPLGDTTYNVNTRPTIITGGNYGIVGDDGRLNIYNGDIINETNNTYYNPSTGNTETIVNWSYDYGDRSYTLTLESGDTVTVTYGDQNITIIEGDTNYTIYYIIEGNGSGSDPDPGPGTSPDPTNTPSPSSPPSGGGDDFDDDGGLIGWLNGLIKYLSDHLSGVVELIKSFFTEIPGMFNGFVEFLAAMFPFLPPEVTLLLTFGMAAVVVIGVIKAIRR